jgi:site-specific DNA-methyltransferase (adenine-specific)
VLRSSFPQQPSTKGNLLNTSSLPLDQIIHGDCIEVMRRFPSQCVNLVVADPPYLVNYKPRDGRRVENDIGNEWLCPAFAELYRILRKDSFCVSFYGWPHADVFLGTWKRLGFAPVSHLVCLKEYSSRTGYTESYHETAYLLAKGSPRRPFKPPRDVFPWSYTGNVLHPAQKPVPVIRALIEAFSTEGNVVLDPFAGSGTTGIAARLSGRRFVLIEKVWRCFEKARNRLDRDLLNRGPDPRKGALHGAT